MQDLQQLMRPQVIRDQAGHVVSRISPVLPTKYKSTKNLKPADFPVCLACKLATARLRSTKVKTSKPVKAKQGILTRDKYKPGDRISCDQYVVKTPGRLIAGFGRESLDKCYNGGTIYQDSALNLVHVQNQILLASGETVPGKAAFEEWIWN